MKSKRNLIVSAVSLLLAAVLCVTGMWFLSNLSHKSAILPEDDFAGGVIDEEGNELISGKEYEFGSDLTFLSASAKSVTSPEGVTLTAVIEPANATNKLVDWSVTYKDPNASWILGKPATNYVTCTPTSDGSLTATVKCLDAFGAQIIVTVTSRSNPNVSATCTVDYMKRFISFDFGFEGKSKIAGTDNYLFNITDYSNEGNANGYMILDNGEQWIAKGSYTLGEGTVLPKNVSESYEFSIPGYKEIARVYTDIVGVPPHIDFETGIIDLDGIWSNYASDTNESYVWTNTLFDGSGFIGALFSSDFYVGSGAWLWDSDEYLGYLYQGLGEYYESQLYYNEETQEYEGDIQTVAFIEVTYTLHYGDVTKTATVGLHMPPENLGIAVQSIKLNQGGITA